MRTICPAPLPVTIPQSTQQASAVLPHNNVAFSLTALRMCACVKTTREASMCTCEAEHKRTGFDIATVRVVM
eukprot:1549175-Rhodomonas_salina.2